MEVKYRRRRALMRLRVGGFDRRVHVRRHVAAPTEAVLGEQLMVRIWRYVETIAEEGTNDIGRVAVHHNIEDGLEARYSIGRPGDLQRFGDLVPHSVLEERCYRIQS
ncbi:hypothetical protein C5B93_03430 [Rathayibacter sp. AY1A2]|nr:hypothetical protein C5B93_03430 [Rathayibacter sp. AY1A2]